MGKILEALASDRLCTAASDYRGSKEYRAARDASCALEKELLGQLTEEGQKLLARYSDAQAEEHMLYASHMFAKGFRLGVLLMVETVAESGDFFLPEQ
ncbi:MAG: hypothetical protein HFH44_04725 [Lachnospiraceae bacterium]|nr:hypothetical protein [Lachnospiraceae bacterium]